VSIGKPIAANFFFSSSFFLVSRPTIRDMNPDKQPGSIAPGTLLKNRYKVVERIGGGAFGEIWSGIDLETNDSVAIKSERSCTRKAVLKMEVAIFKKMQESRFAPRYKTCGRTSGSNGPAMNYLIMELLGENLSDLRKKQPDQRFSLQTTLRLGMEMVSAIAHLHSIGFLHRDIKPSNFVMGCGNRSGNLYIIDFGLARRYVGPSHTIRPPRTSVGFRGTARYASISSHRARELAPRDDLWSFLYLLIEFLVGYLPWRRLRDRERIGEAKLCHNTVDTLVSGLPDCYTHITAYLLSLRYEDLPDYSHIQHCLLRTYRAYGFELDAPLDWQYEGPPRPRYQATTPLYSAPSTLNPTAHQSPAIPPSPTAASANPAAEPAARPGASGPGQLHQTGTSLPVTPKQQLDVIQSSRSPSVSSTPPRRNPGAAAAAAAAEDEDEDVDPLGVTPAAEAGRVAAEYNLSFRAGRASKGAGAGVVGGSLSNKGIPRPAAGGSEGRLLMVAAAGHAAAAFDDSVPVPSSPTSVQSDFSGSGSGAPAGSRTQRASRLQDIVVTVAAADAAGSADGLGDDVAEASPANSDGEDTSSAPLPVNRFGRARSPPPNRAGRATVPVSHQAMPIGDERAASARDAEAAAHARSLAMARDELREAEKKLAKKGKKGAGGAASRTALPEMIVDVMYDDAYAPRDRRHCSILPLFCF
jgi:tau tubulin kinase